MAGGDPLYRYSRQMLVPHISREGQERLQAARVGLIGCGALGSAVAGNLVRAGVGLLRMADKDYPELHNLHRQILYTEQDVARRVPKAEAAAAHLREANSDVVVEPVVGIIDASTISAFAEGLDILVDGTDNFLTRFAINDYAIAHVIPWVYGGVIGSAGMSMTIVPDDGPCLRCFMRELPGPEHSPTADVAGVLNTIVALIASIEASEVVKLVVTPESRNRHLLVADIWDLLFERLVVPRDPGCPCCGA
jgi:molybdopterin-synthase adenylyltransferase